jgi:hypothetical protein
MILSVSLHANSGDIAPEEENSSVLLMNRSWIKQVETRISNPNSISVNNIAFHANEREMPTPECVD